jgi:lipid II:glycine glycyltransferase (peptidoglycan interpeptide bridge formation enzyme)
MDMQIITQDNKNAYNKAVSHPLQSYEWGEFRQSSGVKVIRRGFFSLSIHKIPHTPFSIGYLPKGNLPDQQLIDELRKIGKEEKCIFIQLEPNVMSNTKVQRDMLKLGLKPSARPLFTKYTFILDLTKSEEELLKNMHPKARYNIKVAQKHGVEVAEDNSDEAFKEYLNLMQETTTRQKFYAHTEMYHRQMWKNLKSQKIAHLFIAKYKGQVLTAWVLFVFKDTLYYPYGASTSQHREVMASNLMMWEAIRFGKKLGLKKFDMWGALGPNPDPKDPWFGFHSFKEKYGPQHVEFIGSFDLIINSPLYSLYKIANKLRWVYLKLKK